MKIESIKENVNKTYALYEAVKMCKDEKSVHEEHLKRCKDFSLEMMSFKTIQFPQIYQNYTTASQPEPHNSFTIKTLQIHIKVIVFQNHSNAKIFK